MLYVTIYIINKMAKKEQSSNSTRYFLFNFIAFLILCFLIFNVPFVSFVSAMFYFLVLLLMFRIAIYVFILIFKIIMG